MGTDQQRSDASCSRGVGKTCPLGALCSRGATAGEPERGAGAQGERLDQWMARVRLNGPEELRKALSAFTNWKREILAFFSLSANPHLQWLCRRQK